MPITLLFEWNFGISQLTRVVEVKKTLGLLPWKMSKNEFPAKGFSTTSHLHGSGAPFQLREIRAQICPLILFCQFLLKKSSNLGYLKISQKQLRLTLDFSQSRNKLMAWLGVMNYYWINVPHIISHFLKILIWQTFLNNQK